MTSPRASRPRASRVSSSRRGVTRRTVARPALIAVPAAFTALALTALPALATSTPAQIATSKTNGVGYLRSLQGADGSYAGAGLSNEWAFSAFAAAGTAAVDVAPGGDTSRNARTVYRAHLANASWPGTSPVVTDYERGIINAYSAGVDPARVSASRNLIADTYAYWQNSEPGYWGASANFNGTVFALIALAGAKTQTGVQRVPQALLNRSVTTVRANQHDDGGWTFAKAEGDPAKLAADGDIDMTGAAMAALCMSGVPATDPAITEAKAFLKSKLIRTTGAFDAMFGANTNSNGWAVSGLNACGINPQTGDFLTTAGKTPVDFLIAQQFNPAGGFRYLPGDTGPSAYASVDALRAVAGGGFVAAPPAPTTAGAPRWVAASGFTPGTATELALTVDDGTSLKVCSVAFTPTASTTTLGAVLDAATTAATPSGCVTSVTPGSGTGVITGVNGRTNTGGATWRASVDGAAAAAASRGTVINLGDTISLRYGS
ncbi:prenyltransferase/squalene oxidase repeat-containing protein [Streptomyces sp. NPDC058653]|uniref:prenyltransferase/squalene oxidase repeat-containing protein n=1 Tax=Streptomyces sp. NPDC058653 TaxID=3346576 RepID=UPI0036669FC8